MPTPSSPRPAAAVVAAAAAEAHFSSACDRLEAALAAAREAGFLNDGSGGRGRRSRGGSAGVMGSEVEAAADAERGGDGGDAATSTTSSSSAAPDTGRAPGRTAGRACSARPVVSGRCEGALTPASASPATTPAPPRPDLTTRLASLTRELGALRTAVAEFGAGLGDGQVAGASSPRRPQPPKAAPAPAAPPPLPPPPPPPRTARRPTPRSPLVDLSPLTKRAPRTSGAPPVVKAGAPAPRRRRHPSPPPARTPTVTAVGRVPPSIWDTQRRRLAARPAGVEAALAAYGGRK